VEPADAHRSAATLRVWDPLVRIFHWSLVASFAVAWFTAYCSEDIHDRAGYLAAALVAARLLWGALGPPYARFAQFVRGPATVARYLRAMLGRREARYIGHNPAGGAMVLVLLAAMAATALTGWMMTTDAYFGVDWVQRLHGLIAHGLLLLVVVHVGGVVLACVRHRENLVAAMITGRKRETAAGDVA
jgi:cytochrome b